MDNNSLNSINAEQDEKELKLERSDIDNTYKRNDSKDSYRNRHFNGKRTAEDEYSGETLFISDRGSGNTSGQRHFTTEKTANVDHIVPIDKLATRFEKDVQSGKLTKEDVKEMANADYNLAVTSEKRNKIKSGKSNVKHLVDQAAKGTPEDFNTSFNMIQKEISSNFAMGIDAQGRKINNKLTKISQNTSEQRAQIVKHSSHAMGAGAEAAFMTATVSTINNFVLVATGDKKVKDAAKDIAVDVGESFVSGAGIDLLQALAADQAKKSSNEFIKNYLSKDLPIKEISAAIMIGNSVIRYINDDITAEECITEIVLNGVGSIAYTLGMALGGPAGAIISTVVMGQISKAIIEYQNMNKMIAEKAKKISALKTEALSEMKNQQNCFKQLIKEDFKYWDDTMEKGFEQIFYYACEENYSFEGVTNGLDMILSVFGKEARFKTISEYKNQVKLGQTIIL